MEFQNEALVDREIEIAGYLLQAFTLKDISEKTGLSKKHIAAHIRNMMEKLHAKDGANLLKVLKKWYEITVLRDGTKNIGDDKT